MRPHLPALTGVRALAAFAVYLHHFPPPALVPPLLAKEGYIGVSVFFVLSGAVIAYTYAAAARPDAAWLWGYWRRRFARIWPVYALLTVWTIAATGYRDWLGIGLNLTLTKAFSDHYKFSLIAQGWTLTVEECFYLLAPVLFIALQRRMWWLLALVVVGPFAAGQWWASRLISVYTYPGRCVEFLIGVALGLAIPWLRTVWRPPVGVLTYVGAALFAGLVTALALVDPAGYGIYTASGLQIHNYALPIATGVTLAGLALEHTVVAALLGSPIGVLLGRASYAFYLIHLGVVRDRLAPYASGYWSMVGLLIVASVLIHLAVEEPLRRGLGGSPTRRRQATGRAGAPG